MNKFADRIAAIWTLVNESLFPFIEKTVTEPLTDKLYELIVILEFLRVEEVLHVAEQYGQVGAPPADRAPLLRAFIAKEVLKIPHTKGLLDRLRVDGALRRLCGWERAPAPPTPLRHGITATGKRLRAQSRGKRRHAKRGVPSESTFSRAFASFAAAGVLDLVHAQRVEEHLGDQLFEHGAYDGTAISVQERPVSQPPKPPRVPQRQGRPKKGEERPAPPPARLQQQRQSKDLAAIIDELPTACDKGGKKNSKGDTEWWNGYKMHILSVDGDIPVAALTTSASMHDSGAVIPLMRLARQRGVTILFDLMDSAYDGAEIHRESLEMGHVPIIAVNNRSADYKKEVDILNRLDFSRLDVERALVEPDRRRRFKARSSVERVNSRLKEGPEIRNIRLRGHPKVHARLMCNILIIFAKALLCW